MDPTNSQADFGRLVQYGGVGIIAAVLLTLIVGIFRQLIAHALKQNEQLAQQQHDLQAKTLEALHAVGQRLQALENTVHALKVEFSRDVGQLFNEVQSFTEGSRAHKTRPR